MCIPYNIVSLSDPQMHEHERSMDLQPKQNLSKPISRSEKEKKKQKLRNKIEEEAEGTFLNFYAPMLLSPLWINSTVSFSQSGHDPSSQTNLISSDP